nr:uncharacterized protein LOC113813888 [Penaeus vannamei]
MTKNKCKNQKKSDDEKKQFRQWEAARRQRFNKGLDKLRLVLPDGDPKTKVEIIHSAIEYIQESKTFKENVLAGNEAQELKRVIRRLRKQVEILKQRNAILVKLLQETGLRIESDASGGEIIYTTPGTCVQSNCSNASCKKVTCGTRIPVLLGDLSSECIDDSLEEDDAVNSSDLHPRDPTEKLATVSSLRTQQPVFTEQDARTQENTDISNSPEDSGNKQGGKEPAAEKSPENASEASLPAGDSSGFQDEDVGVPIPAVSDEGTAQTLVPQQDSESESPRIASESENAASVSALSHNFVSAQLTSLSIESENEHISVLPQNCASDLKCEKTKEKILVEEVSKNGTITVSIIEEEGTQTEEASNNGSSKLSNRKLDGEGSDKTMGTAKELSLASSETCLVVQDMQHVTVHPEIQPQSIPATQSVPVSASNFYGNPTQMVTIQVHGGEKVQNKGQKVVLLQCGNSAPGTFQLVPPIADNSQLTYVTPSLSGVPIMSTGVPPSILQTGNLVKVVNSPPVLLLPPQPMISSLPHATKLKPIAPKPCSCKPVASSQTKDVSGGIIASLPKNQGQVSPVKRDLVHTPTKVSAKVKRPLSLERNNGKAAKRSKGDFSAELPTMSKVPADIQPLQSSGLNPKTVTVNQVELASEDGEDLQEISTTTLTGLVHSAGIMDCVGEDALGNIMDIPVDMPCVMTENIRSSGIEPSNPTDDRLVEMLRSIDESDPRACEFSPPSSPVSGTDPLVEQGKGPEVQDETAEVSSGDAENSKICEENQAISAEGNEPSSVTLENQQDVGVEDEECPVPTSSCTSAESSVTSNSYSITALCLSSRPLKEQQSLVKDFGKASVSSSAPPVQSSDVESVAQRTPVTVSAESTDHTRVSTPLVLPTTSGEYYLSKTPLPSREHLPKASSAPTVCQLPLPPATALPPPNLFLRNPSVLPSSSHSLSLPLPPLPLPPLPPLTTEHHSATLLSSPSVSYSNISIPVTSTSSLTVSNMATSSVTFTKTSLSDPVSPAVISLPNLFTAPSTTISLSNYHMPSQSPSFSFSLTMPSASSGTSVTNNAASVSSNTSSTWTPTVSSLFSSSFLHSLSTSDAYNSGDISVVSKDSSKDLQASVASTLQSHSSDTVDATVNADAHESKEQRTIHVATSSTLIPSTLSASVTDVIATSSSTTPVVSSLSTSSLSFSLASTTVSLPESLVMPTTQSTIAQSPAFSFMSGLSSVPQLITTTATKSAVSTSHSSSISTVETDFVSASNQPFSTVITTTTISSLAQTAVTPSTAGSIFSTSGTQTLFPSKLILLAENEDTNAHLSKPTTSEQLLCKDSNSEITAVSGNIEGISSVSLMDLTLPTSQEDVQVSVHSKVKSAETEKSNGNDQNYSPKTLNSNPAVSVPTTTNTVTSEVGKMHKSSQPKQAPTAADFPVSNNKIGPVDLTPLSVAATPCPERASQVQRGTIERDMRAQWHICLAPIKLFKTETKYRVFQCKK